MKSMTGFGSAQFQVKGVSSNVTVRTVNGRYLEVRTHLPRELQNIEMEIKSLIKKHFARGTVDVSVQVSSTENLHDYSVELDQNVAKEWLHQAQKLKKSLKISGEVDLNSLISLPGVLVSHKKSRLEGADKIFLKGILGAIKQCEKMRLSEGSSLKKILLTQLSSLDEVCLKIGKAQKKIEEDLSQSLKKDIEQELTVEGRNVLESRASDSLERMNIEEELARLSEHIKAVKKLIGLSGATGKKMDFYAQEFLREMNTVGSKSATSLITGLVVEGKSLIESFREQVQNIE
jgi:uncharacterized protein (TIGR00255 family)